MKKKRFTLFHLSCIPVREPTFHADTSISRSDWIKKILDNPFEFHYRGGANLFWSPQHADLRYVIGIIQKEKLHTLHHPPQMGGGEYVTEEWQGAYVILDPYPHEDGQKLAVENDVVGKPNTLAKALCEYLNHDPDRPFHLEIEEIFDSQSFWAFSEERGDVLRSITFDFVVPNMWVSRKGIAEDLRRAREITKSQKVEVKYSSELGVATKNQIIKDGVDYTSRGAGELKARGMDGETYTSKDTPLTSEVVLPDGENISASEIAEFSEKILGRPPLDTSSEDN